MVGLSNVYIEKILQLKWQIYLTNRHSVEEVVVVDNEGDDHIQEVSAEGVNPSVQTR